MPNFPQIASRLTPRGWLLAGGGTLGAVLVLYMIMHAISQPSYSTLITGLEPAQTGKMTAALNQKGIAYQLENGGTALAVQSNETAQARVALAGAGLMEGNQQGFSLLDKTSLGESNFQQQVTYQRALQGQLAQNIDQIDGISGAQVELVLPNTQGQLFSENQTPPSAAVLLAGSASPEPATVRGIAHLVASSVPGLKTSNVTITGGSGQLLWPSGESGEGGEGSSRQAAEQRYDQAMASSIGAMLTQTLGPGKAQVQVYANLNVNKTTQEQLTYGKTGVPLEQSKNLETLQGSGAAGGAGANIPATAGGGKSNYKHEITSSTMGVNKTVTHSTVAPGEVVNQHVSVLLDKSVRPSEVPAIKEAVANAAGVEPKRGDTIYIGQMAFSKAAAGGAGGSSSMMGYAKDVLGAIVALVFLFFTTRFLRKREAAPIEHDPSWLKELETPVRLAELEREVGGGTVRASGNGAARPPERKEPREQVAELVSISPERIANQLRSWMNEE